ncbi:hypothetical protein D3C80_1657450 [compost metagenome]
MHGEQRAIDIAVDALHRPGFSAITAGQDRAPVANGPAVAGIDEADTGQRARQGYAAGLPVAAALVVRKQHDAMVANGHHPLPRFARTQHHGLHGIASRCRRHRFQPRGPGRGHWHGR